MTMAAVVLATGLFQAAPCDLKDLPADAPPPAGVECGWVSVPRDHAAPDGPTLRLWTARLKAAGPAGPDAVLYIHGGPGIATVDALLPSLDKIKSLAAMRANSDVYLFDQRGSGRSEETLCPDLDRQLGAVADLGLDAAQEDERSRILFAQCRAALDDAGTDLAAYTTAQTAADLETLRQAFGVRQWNLSSVSYGTLVALHAMRTQPASLRAVILNSPYPPNSMAWAEQASSTAAAYQAIGRACAAQPACASAFGDVVEKLKRTLARLDRTPVLDGERKITGRLFATALWPVAVRSTTVKFVPLAISRAHAGDADAIKGLVRTFASGNAFGDASRAQGFAISCHEGGRTRDAYARARALYPALVSATPDDSWDKLCAAFRPGYADPAFFAPVASSIPTLIYAGALDPATPVADAYQAVRFLDRATIVEVAGAAHAPLGLDECTIGIATAFLDDPQATPDLACLRVRTPLAFAQEGLETLFAPAP